jgi:hypothetical protein
MEELSAEAVVTRQFLIVGMLPAQDEWRTAMTLEETVGNLATFLNSLDADGEKKFELSHSFVIICPDCGQNVAFRGRCPKCGGDSWIPAGHAGGVVARTRVLRWQKLMHDNENKTGAGRRNPTRRGLRGVATVAAPLASVHRNGSRS